MRSRTQPHALTPATASPLPRRSSVQDHLNPPPGKETAVTRRLGRILQAPGGGLSGRDRLRVLAYSAAQGALTVAGLLASYLPYKYDTAEGHLTFAYVLVVFGAALYNGAGWYKRNITGFTRVRAPG